jgi:hypothetical protein
VKSGHIGTYVKVGENFVTKFAPCGGPEWYFLEGVGGGGGYKI